MRLATLTESLSTVRQLLAAFTIHLAPVPATVAGTKQRRGIMESLYGYRVVDDGQPIDQFLLALDQMYLDFDLDNQKVQALAQKLFGKVPTPPEWHQLITGSGQPDGLKQQLLGMVKLPAGPKAAALATSQSGLKPGRITMKRGTVIDADHIVGASKGVYFLVGIGPGLQPVRHGKCRWLWHPDFQQVRMVPATQANLSNDPHSTCYEIASKFKTIMSMNPANIAKIEWADGTVTTF